MLLSKKQFITFLIIAIIVTLPFLLLAIFQPVCNESTLIFALHFVAGIPWVFLYTLLPFDIMGSTPSDGINSCIGILGTLLIYIPIYINLFILMKLLAMIGKILKKQP